MKPWKVVSRKTHRHSPYKQIEDVEYELPDGRLATYALNKIGQIVTVLALTGDQRVILARQFRPGPGAILDELPGGFVDEGESAEEAALRELREETGYVPGQKLIPLGRYFEGAYSIVEIRGFLALDCRRAHDQAPDPNEFIEVVLKTLPEFLAQLRAGDTTDGEVSWSGLLAAGLLKPQFS